MRKNNKNKRQKLLLESEPSFKPKINQKSKMMSKRVRNTVKKEKLSSQNMISGKKYRSPLKSISKDPIACLLNYDIEEISEKDSLKQSKIDQKQEHSQINPRNDEEIQEISEFINGGTKPRNEFEMSSEEMMNLIFAQTNQIQEELDNFSKEQDHKDLNDREEFEIGDKERKTEELSHEIQDKKFQSQNSKRSSINNRESIDEDDEYNSHNHPTEAEFYKNKDMENFMQNGLNHPSKEELGEEIEIKNHNENEEEKDFHTPLQRINNLEILETVGEASIEETLKQDMTIEEKFMNSLEPN